MAEQEADESEGRELLPVTSVRNCRPSVLKTGGQSTKNHLSVTILDLGQQPSFSDNEDQRSFLSSQDGPETAEATPDGDGNRRGSQTSQKENFYGKLVFKKNKKPSNC